MYFIGSEFNEILSTCFVMTTEKDAVKNLKKLTTVQLPKFLEGKAKAKVKRTF